MCYDDPHSEGIIVVLLLQIMLWTGTLPLIQHVSLLSGVCCKETQRNRENWVISLKKKKIKEKDKKKDKKNICVKDKIKIYVYIYICMYLKAQFLPTYAKTWILQVHRKDLKNKYLNSI